MITIQQLRHEDISTIIAAFPHKAVSTFEKYLAEQSEGRRFCWIARHNELFVGYVTLVLESKYQHFSEDKVPEVMDLNVVQEFRGQGIGTKLLRRAEQKAFNHSKVVGLGVGLYVGADGGYGSAQRLYIRNGYVPDGKGVTYNYESVVPGNAYQVDDNLVLWLTKTSIKDL
jgi:GNAT superfamily N-acetyltransferase